MPGNIAQRVPTWRWKNKSIQKYQKYKYFLIYHCAPFIESFVENCVDPPYL